VADWKRMSNRSRAATLDAMGIPHGIKVREQQKERVSREGPVVKAVCELLAAHPATALVVRQNSGSASYEHSSGKWAPINFYTLWKPTKDEVTVVDVWGFLKTGRYYAFECKAPGFKHPRDDRERRQAMFLMLVRNCGGIAMFVTDVQQVQEALHG
jgi:hypothetical protein